MVAVSFLATCSFSSVWPILLWSDPIIVVSVAAKVNKVFGLHYGTIRKKKKGISYRSISLSLTTSILQGQKYSQTHLLGRYGHMSPASTAAEGPGSSESAQGSKPRSPGELTKWMPSRRFLFEENKSDLGFSNLSCSGWYIINYWCSSIFIHFYYIISISITHSIHPSRAPLLWPLLNRSAASWAPAISPHPFDRSTKRCSMSSGVWASSELR